jgi:hypothetical protein
MSICIKSVVVKLPKPDWDVLPLDAELLVVDGGVVVEFGEIVLTKAS